MTIGRRLVRGSARTRRSTSRPFTLGSFRSRSTTASWSSRPPLDLPLEPRRYSSASAPSRATTTSLRMLFFFSARSVSASSSGLSSTSSTILLSSNGPSLPESEVDGRPLAGSADGPHPSAVPGHDALDGGQTDPDPRELVLAVQTLERPEQLVRVRHLEPRPVVPDKIGPLARLLGETELDPGRGALAGELPRVPDQVLQGRAQERRIARHDGSSGDHALHLTSGIAGTQLPDDFVREEAEVDAPVPDLRARHAREIQESVDEVAHPDGRPDDPLERVLARLAETVGAILRQRPAEALDAAQRRAQIVRDGVGERLELLVGDPELGGALGDALLELVAGAPQRALLLAYLLEHLVEGRDQRSDLVAARAQGAHRVVLLEGDPAGDSGEIEDRLRDAALQSRRDDQGDQERSQEHADEGDDVTRHRGGDLAEIRHDHHAPDRLPVEHDVPPEHKPVVPQSVAVARVAEAGLEQ